MEIEFLPQKQTNLEFCFKAEDYTLDDMVYEINKFLTEKFWFPKNIEIKGDWTRVPVIYRKIRMIRDDTLWDK